MKREKVETSGIWRWPLLRQIRYGTRGTGVEVMSNKTRSLRARTDDAKVSRSICPYCAVGCGQLIYHKDGKVISIEGDPESPISQGNLCPKGAASRQLLQHDGRVTKVKYRAPYAKEWQDLTLYEAMDMIADRVWDSRKRTFIEGSPDGASVNHTTGITHLGGATLDNEENYLIRKLFGAGLGMAAISNQARI
ncbi:MAG: molybdopterin oxidoreductase Fe4S4 region [Verrucomicrobiales bacterium]|nr:molybdopterin oxidoreductase Fe4S4 region [Verrucomicrobiales bacterium]